MKLDNRLRLRCTKIINLNTGIMDSFSVVVFKADEGVVKNRYESMGYTVTRVNL